MAVFLHVSNDDSSGGPGERKFTFETHEIAYIKNKRFIIPHMRCSGFVRCTRAQGARVAGERCVKEKEELEV